jgi:4-oxalocrotonate tautomerase family enzyme
LEDPFRGFKKLLCNGGVKLPVVQVSAWAGMSKENKKKVVEGMIKVLKELGIPKNAITIIINEIPKTNWATVESWRLSLKLTDFLHLNSYSYLMFLSLFFNNAISSIFFSVIFS